MLKLLQGDFKYNAVKLIGITLTLLVFIIASMFFNEKLGINVDSLRGFITGFFSVILFIPQIIYYQEKRIRLYIVLPVKPAQIGLERIVITILEFVTITFLLFIIKFFIRDIIMIRYYEMFEIFLFAVSGVLFLRDKWFSYFEKKKRIITVVSYLISFLLPTGGIIWYFGGSIKNTGSQKGNLLQLVLLLIGSAILMLTINSFNKRKIYLN